jgi:hypothetical protein
MPVGWDQKKAADNLAKHGVRFADAEPVLYDPRAVTLEDLAAQGERRYVTIGLDTVGRILVAVYTYREDEVRLISVRRATRRERRAYEEGI